MPDQCFAHPRLAAVYDALDPDRSDLDHYAALIAELGARTVLDVGCGTGTLACRLAAAGLDVVGVDPAAASLDMARAKPGAGRVRWIEGDATTLPPDVGHGAVDVAVMTANVAQVFLTDEAWAATLAGIRAALAPGGHLVFETRDPARRAWEGWTPERTRTTADVPGVGVVTSRHVVTEVALPLVTFETRFRFEADGTELVSTSTLRFRSRGEVEASLAAAGFEVREVGDAPDRPGREFVFIAAVP